jgi:hypothetical protein
MLTPNDFLDLMDEKKIDKTVRFGKIDPSHVSGRPKVLFDGNSTVSTKKFPYVSSYTPAANDRIIVLKNVIIGKIV